MTASTNPSTPANPVADSRPNRWGTLFRAAFALAIVGLIVGYSVYFQVPEGSAGVVTRFGRPVQEVTKAGPYLKWPWPIDQVHLIDTRRRLFNTRFTATQTSDLKNVILLTYVVWRVNDPLTFFERIGDTETAEDKLDGMAIYRKNVHVGRHELSALVSLDPAKIQSTKIENAILHGAGELSGLAEAGKEFGIEVEEVGIKRIGYDPANVRSVLENMRADRVAVARQTRAEGEQAANKIKGQALVESRETVKEGVEQAAAIKAEALREVAQTFADVERLDPEFFSHWMQLQSLTRIFGSDSTILMTPDWSLFRLLKEKPPAPQPAGQPKGAEGQPKGARGLVPNEDAQ